MFICVERENKERSIVSLYSCKIKLNKSGNMVTLEGPEKTSIYFGPIETIFLIKSEEVAINFLKRKSISFRDIHLTIIGEPSKLEGIKENDK